MDQAYHDARTLGWARRPIVEMLIPQHARRQPGPARTARGQPVLPTLRPHFAERRELGRPPRGGRRRRHRRGGHLRAQFRRRHHRRAKSSPRWTWNAASACWAAISSTGRSALTSCSAHAPCWGHADYRGPIAGLYMCGSGTHPARRRQRRPRPQRRPRNPPRPPSGAGARLGARVESKEGQGASCGGQRGFGHDACGPPAPHPPPDRFQGLVLSGVRGRAPGLALPSIRPNPQAGRRIALAGGVYRLGSWNEWDASAAGWGG